MDGLRGTLICDSSFKWRVLIGNLIGPWKQIFQALPSNMNLRILSLYTSKRDFILKSKYFLNSWFFLGLFRVRLWAHLGHEIHIYIYMSWFISIYYLLLIIYWEKKNHLILALKVDGETIFRRLKILSFSLNIRYLNRILLGFVSPKSKRTNFGDYHSKWPWHVGLVYDLLCHMWCLTAWTRIVMLGTSPCCFSMN